MFVETIWIWIIAVVALYVYFAMRFVSETERIIIYSGTQVVKVAGPGQVFVWPFFQASKKVSLSAQSAKIYEVQLGDSVCLPLACTFVFRLADAAKVDRFDDSGVQMHRTREVIADCLTEVLSRATVYECLRDKARLECNVADRANRQTKEWGVRIVLVDFGEMQVPRQLVQHIMCMSAIAASGLSSGFHYISWLNEQTAPAYIKTKLDTIEPVMVIDNQ